MKAKKKQDGKEAKWRRKLLAYEAASNCAQHKNILALRYLNWNESASSMTILYAPMSENAEMVYDDILPTYLGISRHQRNNRIFYYMFLHGICPYIGHSDICHYPICHCAIGNTW